MTRIDKGDVIHLIGNDTNLGEVMDIREFTLSQQTPRSRQQAIGRIICDMFRSSRGTCHENGTSHFEITLLVKRSH